MHFGATLRILRTDAGRTLRDLGEAVGVSSAYLSRVENGHDAIPTPDRLRAIARALGLAPAALLDVSDEVRPFATEYIDRVPAARELFSELIRRDLSDAQLARVKAFIDREFPRSTARGAGGASLLAELAPERIVTGFSCTDFDDVLDVVATRLSSHGLSREVSEALHQRERESSTLAGHGFALPQAIVPGVDAAAAMITLRKPLRLGTPDGRPLRVVLAQVHPRRVRTRLEQLVHLAKVADDDLADALGAATHPRQALKILEQALAE